MKKTDLPILARIYTKVYAKLDIGEHWTNNTAELMLSYWLKKQPDLALVAELNNEVVGAFTSAIKPWWDGNHLMDGELFVSLKHQNKGIGKELLKTLFKKALEKYNATSFDAFTYTKTEFPLSWYDSLGIKVNKDYAVISGSITEALTKMREKNSIGKNTQHNEARLLKKDRNAYK